MSGFYSLPGDSSPGAPKLGPWAGVCQHGNCHETATHRTVVCVEEVRVGEPGDTRIAERREVRLTCQAHRPRGYLGPGHGPGLGRGPLMASYGTVTRTGPGVAVRGLPRQLQAWARRPGARWPGSVLALARRPVVAEFAANGDLVDLTGDPPELSADELNAWTSDVLAETLARGVDAEEAAVLRAAIRSEVEA